VKKPVWIEKDDALALHDRLLALDGGAAGLRGVGLLESALARQQQHYFYSSAGALELAAIYTAGYCAIILLSMETSARAF
jgi:death on curing protein